MNNSITRYVLGLMLSPDRKHVVLIRKNRPSFLAGLLNGVGGHIEEGETPVEAMTREFNEEAGLDVPQSAWTCLGVLTGDTYEVLFYFVLDDRFAEVRTLTDEPVQSYERISLGDDVTADIRNALRRIDSRFEEVAVTA